MAVSRDPIREWRAQYGRQMLNLDFEPLSDAPFQASSEPIFDGMRMVRSSFSPGLTVRDQELVRDGDDSFTFLISRSNRLAASQPGRTVELASGDATLLRVDRPGFVGQNRHFKYIAIMIPFEELRDCAPAAIDAAMSRTGRRTEPLQLLRAYIRSLEIGRLGSSEGARETIRRHIIELTGLSVTLRFTLGESDLGAVSAARAAAAFRYIELHFREPDLSVLTVAQALKISPRYLQKLLEGTETAFTSYVNELRLNHASMLLQQGGSRVRISDIAFQCGFSDISHFNRIFRARFGETPSGVRSNARGADRAAS